MSSLRPGQLTPNELEHAILERVVARHPRLATALRGLHVLRREYTGVGSFTEFRIEEPGEGEAWRADPGALVRIPGLEHGLGAVLFCQGDRPQTLETYTFEEEWDGVFEGFRFAEESRPGG